MTCNYMIIKEFASLMERSKIKVKAFYFRISFFMNLDYAALHQDYELQMVIIRRLPYEAFHYIMIESIHDVFVYYLTFLYRKQHG